MASPAHSIRPTSYLKQVFRQCRSERALHRRQYATATLTPVSHHHHPYPSLAPSKYPLPSPGFRPGQATKQNRNSEAGLRKIPVLPSPRSTTKSCPDPIAALTEQQLKVLDPTGVRTRLFSRKNPEKAQQGDILLVRFKNGDPFSGVCLAIRQRHSPIDTSILLRNQLTRVGVEMWVKIYSPNVEGIEVVQRKQGRRARRAKLYYMRQPRHDVGSVENIVRQYMRQRGSAGVGGHIRGRDTGSHKKKNNKRGRN
ncbi:hypothetical protein K431DRAFT_239183 [Polychaeton citri CBS 116435]|uniref:Ribosomal protein L19 n=1 Tax=Polychaeton citri CBS 116435 TaxID=1314669 RepID=A0A9P4QGH6_9PEZI|nr:hypothetical protein K431DRAFT_239183 [Polychaeton citri CBS 116435]